MAKDYTQVNFRIPTKLKEDIEKAAQGSERSITAEIVARLEKSFDQTDNFATKAELQAQVSYLEGVIEGYDSVIKKITEDIKKTQ